MQEKELKTLLLLLILKKEQRIGRYHLKEILDMQGHEGIVRRMLEDLKRRQWVRPTRSGCLLTQEGEEAIETFLKEKGMVHVEQIDLRGCIIGPESAVIQLRDRTIARPILTLRDSAVKVGAGGALILTYQNGELGDYLAYRSLSARHPEVTQILKNSLHLLENDIVIVGFADIYPRALEGALAIGIEIDKSENEK
ncbi:hypothetical protein MUP77_24985 [Candidatus Bathyarchaeota archaeon]|nr:hypothetical protein [Candidatus Bathyarchaeota archaeon]